MDLKLKHIYGNNPIKQIFDYIIFGKLAPDEFVVTARMSASADVPTNPTWGGSSNGSGNMFINSLNGDVYIYS